MRRAINLNANFSVLGCYDLRCFQLFLRGLPFLRNPHQSSEIIQTNPWVLPHTFRAIFSTVYGRTIQNWRFFHHYPNHYSSLTAHFSIRHQQVLLAWQIPPFIPNLSLYHSFTKNVLIDLLMCQWHKSFDKSDAPWPAITRTATPNKVTNVFTRR